MPIAPINIETNQHDDKRFFFSVVDQNGDPVLIDDLTNMIFSIAQNISSPSLLQKTLLTGTLIKSGDSEVFFDLSSAESGLLDPGSLFVEAKVYEGTIEQTVGQGTLTVIDTQIGDYT